MGLLNLICAWFLGILESLMNSARVHPETDVSAAAASGVSATFQYANYNGIMRQKGLSLSPSRALAAHVE